MVVTVAKGICTGCSRLGPQAAPARGGGSGTLRASTILPPVRTEGLLFGLGTPPAVRLHESSCRARRLLIEHTSAIDLRDSERAGLRIRLLSGIYKLPFMPAFLQGALSAAGVLTTDSLLDAQTFALHTLIDNAYDAIFDLVDPHGHVQTRLLADDATLIIEVEDSGAGIAAELLPTLLGESQSKKRGKPLTYLGGAGKGLQLILHSDLYCRPQTLAIDSRHGDQTPQQVIFHPDGSHECIPSTRDQPGTVVCVVYAAPS